MKHLRTEIIVKSSAERVWKTLMDFSGHAQWNPFIKSIEGSPQKGAALKVRMQPPGKSAMIFKPKVTEITEGKRFEWLGNLFISGIFDGRHYFEIEELGDGQVKFIQGEYFSGFLSGILWRSIGESTREGFVAMNTALKELVEGS